MNSPTLDALRSVIEKGAIAVPAFAPGGPFATSPGQLINIEMLDAPERAALATLYVALMSDLALELLAADGDVIVDGPLAPTRFSRQCSRACARGTGYSSTTGEAIRSQAATWLDLRRIPPQPCHITPPVAICIAGSIRGAVGPAAAALRSD